MTIASSVPTVVTAVLAAVTTAVTGQTAASGSDVQVSDGELGTYVADEFVQIISVTGGRQEWGAIGKQRRNESYDINGMVRAYVGSEDQAYCRSRVFALFALIETAVDNDPQLGAVVNGSIQASPTDLRMGVTEHGGRAAELDFVLSVTTQLIAT